MYCNLLYTICSLLEKWKQRTFLISFLTPCERQSWSLKHELIIFLTKNICFCLNVWLCLKILTMIHIALLESTWKIGGNSCCLAYWLIDKFKIQNYIVNYNTSFKNLYTWKIGLILAWYDFIWTVILPYTIHCQLMCTKEEEGKAWMILASINGWLIDWVRGFLCSVFTTVY